MRTGAVAQNPDWGNQNDDDYLDYYNGKFMGFTRASVSNPDGSLTVHKYDATRGWGLYDAPGTAPNFLPCDAPNPCHADPWWAPGNALHGHEVETDQYDTDGTTLLSKTTTQYSVTCPPSGVSGTGSTSYGNFDGNLVSELDHNNPVAACDIQTSQVDAYTYDGSTASGVPHQTTTYQYDSYGRVTQTTITSNDGGATGSPTTIITKTSYIWNDAVSIHAASATGTYLIDFPAFSDTEDSSGNRYSCTYTSYDGQAYATGQQSGLTLGEATTADQYTNCGTKANNFTDQSGLIRTTSTYDTYGNSLTTTDPDANAGISGHVGCTPTGGSGTYTTCTNYDTTFHVLPVSSANALNQTASIGYGSPGDPTGGFGLWPTSTTDVNGQTTTMTYDGLGRPTSQTLPGETSGLTTTTTSYTTWCPAGSAQSPCVEIDTTQRLNSTTTVTTRAFYDGYGRLVETRAPGPNNQDVVQYRFYDTSGRDVNDSNRYFVSPSYTGDPGPNAYSIPDSTQPGTSTIYTNLRSTTVKDALSDISTTTLAVVCNAPGTGDTACYEQTLSVDPLGHQSGMLTDALGRDIYDQRYTGNSSATYAVYATTQYTYDFLGDLVQILHPNGVTKTTFQYDMAGRQTGMTDPDLGTESYGYDANGNVIQTADARGATGTIYAGYDGLNRQIWRNTTNSPTGAYVTYSYDSIANGNHGVGRLTGESFTGGPNQSLSGSYSDVYDVRGQEIQTTLTVGGTAFPISYSYNDAGVLLSLTYPNGDVLTTNFIPPGWFGGLTLQQGNAQTTLLNNLNYTGTSGAAGLFSSASLNGGTYTETVSYDLLLRLTDAKITRSSNQATLFEESDSYDNASRVTGTTTTLAQGTDVQQFCYDEQNRLTWAGSVGTPPCTGAAITPGSLTSAQYTQGFSYDTLGRLTSGPLGTYTYGDSHHLHAATAIGSSYSASYDASGNMTCRAPTSATTCTGSQPTGASLSYDNEGRLSAWQNAPSNPSTTSAYLYDGEGNRVEQQTTQSGTATTTVYVGRLEEVTTTGTTTTTLTYYGPIAMAINGVLSYLVTNRLGSVTEALDTSGNVQASQLYAPYGGLRYSNGTMPTNFGFTGQRQDALTGLAYFGARYYDSQAAQFTSPDLVLPGAPWGLSRYAYVEGDPENFTDPTGYKPSDGGGGVGVLEPPPVDVPPDVDSNLMHGAPCDCMYSGSNVLEAHGEDWSSIPNRTYWYEPDGVIMWKTAEGLGFARLPGGQVIPLDGAGNPLVGPTVPNNNPFDTYGNEYGSTTNDGTNNGTVPDQYGNEVGGVDPNPPPTQTGSGGGGQKPPPPTTSPSPPDEPPRRVTRKGFTFPHTPIDPNTGEEMGQVAFGKAIGWGRGLNDPILRMETLTFDELQNIGTGTTKEIAYEWYEFYMKVFADNPNNSSAQGRMYLMEYAWLLILLSEPFSFP